MLSCDCACGPGEGILFDTPEVEGVGVSEV